MWIEVCIQRAKSLPNHQIRTKKNLNVILHSNAYNTLKWPLLGQKPRNLALSVFSTSTCSGRDGGQSNMAGFNINMSVYEGHPTLHAICAQQNTCPLRFSSTIWLYYSSRHSFQRWLTVCLAALLTSAQHWEYTEKRTLSEHELYGWAIWRSYNCQNNHTKTSNAWQRLQAFHNLKDQQCMAKAANISQLERLATLDKGGQHFHSLNLPPGKAPDLSQPLPTQPVPRNKMLARLEVGPQRRRACAAGGRPRRSLRKNWQQRFRFYREKQQRKKSWKLPSKWVQAVAKD